MSTALVPDRCEPDPAVRSTRRPAVTVARRWAIRGRLAPLGTGGGTDLRFHRAFGGEVDRTFFATDRRMAGCSVRGIETARDLPGSRAEIQRDAPFDRPRPTDEDRSSSVGRGQSRGRRWGSSRGARRLSTLWSRQPARRSGRTCSVASPTCCAVERHPAMPHDLDDRQSFGPIAMAGRKRGRGPDANLARELHTLGAGYHQADVTAVVRAPATAEHPAANPVRDFAVDPARPVFHRLFRARPGAACRDRRRRDPHHGAEDETTDPSAGRVRQSASPESGMNGGEGGRRSHSIQCVVI